MSPYLIMNVDAHKKDKQAAKACLFHVSILYSILVIYELPITCYLAQGRYLKGLILGQLSVVEVDDSWSYHQVK